MTRTVITPDSDTVSISVTDYYIGKVLEVIAFTKEERLYNIDHDKKKPSFTVLHTNVKNF